jgi:hypothetical protein
MWYYLRPLMYLLGITLQVYLETSRRRKVYWVGDPKDENIGVFSSRATAMRISRNPRETTVDPDIIVYYEVYVNCTGRVLYRKSRGSFCPLTEGVFEKGIPPDTSPPGIIVRTSTSIEDCTNKAKVAYREFRKKITSLCNEGFLVYAYGIRYDGTKGFGLCTSDKLVSKIKVFENGKCQTSTKDFESLSLEYNNTR